MSEDSSLHSIKSHCNEERKDSSSIGEPNSLTMDEGVIARESKCSENKENSSLNANLPPK